MLIETDLVAPRGEDYRTAILLAVNRFSDQTATIFAQHDSATASETERLLGMVIGDQLLKLEKMGLRVTATVERGLPSGDLEPPYNEVLLTKNLIGSLEARHIRILSIHEAAVRLGVSVTELVAVQWHAERVYREVGGYVSPFARFLHTSAA